MDEHSFGYPYAGGPYDPPGTYPPQPYQHPPFQPAIQPVPQQTQNGYQPVPRQDTEAMFDRPALQTGEGFKPLSRQEREEAARAAAANFSFDGYQVVRREFTSHRFDPTLTIRENAIIFNSACISRLDEVVYVQLMINPDTAMLAVRPCDEGARDAIRWCVLKEDKRKSRQIFCKMFAAKLYDMMGWQAPYRYKIQGAGTTYQGQELFVFDLTNTEVFIPVVQNGAGPDAGPKKKTEQRFMADWRDSFGLPVKEHDALTRIDLGEGYDTVSTPPAVPEQSTLETVHEEKDEVTKE